MDEKIMNPEDYGTVKISNEVIGVIANLAITEVDGIIGLASSFAEGFANIIAKKGLHKGIKISMNEDKAIIDLSVLVAYGVKIHEVCAKAQESVKKSVETMTGIDVESVNIYVQDVIVPTKDEEEIIEME